MDINNLPFESEGSVFDLNANIQPNPTKELWSECLKSIKTRVNSQSYKTWFEPIVPLGLDRNRFTLSLIHI